MCFIKELFLLVSVTCGTLTQSYNTIKKKSHHGKIRILVPLPKTPPTQLTLKSLFHPIYWKRQNKLFNGSVKYYWHNYQIVLSSMFSVWEDIVSFTEIEFRLAITNAYLFQLSPNGKKQNKNKQETKHGVQITWKHFKIFATRISGCKDLDISLLSFNCWERRRVKSHVKPDDVEAADVPGVITGQVVKEGLGLVIVTCVYHGLLLLSGLMFWVSSFFSIQCLVICGYVAREYEKKRFSTFNGWLASS